jgi:hypothetical protein
VEVKNWVIYTIVSGKDLCKILKKIGMLKTIKQEVILFWGIEIILLEDYQFLIIRKLQKEL